MAVSLPEIVGRDQELAATAAFLDGDLPAALVLAGEAGIGKTTVWRAALEQAREHDLRVLVCRPAESEAHLSYAGLSDLLEPVLDERLEALPAVQRRALETALLLSEREGPPPDQRTISTACLVSNSGSRAFALLSPWWLYRQVPNEEAARLLHSY